MATSLYWIHLLLSHPPSGRVPHDAFEEPMLAATVLFAVATVAPPDIEEAQRLFYNGRYDAAEEATLALCTDDPAALAACELRSSTLLFQIKRVLAGHRDRDAALKQCTPCAD